MKIKNLTILLASLGLAGFAYAADKKPEHHHSTTDARDEVSHAAHETKEATKNAWEETKETSKEAWEETKEASKEAWEATKEGAKEAYQETREFFANMSSESKQAWAHTRRELAAKEKSADMSSDEVNDDMLVKRVRADRAAAALANIEMTVEGDQLILSGEVANEQVREDIVEAAEEATDYEVRDELTVSREALTRSSR